MVLLNIQSLTSYKDTEVTGSHNSLDCSFQLPNQEDIIKIQKQDLGAGCEGLSVTSQSTVAMMCDDFSQTNTLDSNDSLLPFEEIDLSKEIGVFKRFKNARGSQNSRVRESKGMPLNSYKYSKKMAPKSKFRGNNFKPIYTRGKHRLGFRSSLLARSTGGIPEETFKYTSNLTFENLSKLDSKTDFLKNNKELIESNNIQDINKESITENFSNLESSIQTDFFWTIKQRSESFKDKTKDKTARDREKKHTEDLSNDDRSDVSALSSSDSNRGLVNQKYYRRNVNMCDNQSDMWYGLKTKDGKPVFVSSKQMKGKSNGKWIHNKKNIKKFKIQKNDKINNEKTWNSEINHYQYSKRKNYIQYNYNSRGPRKQNHMWRQRLPKVKAQSKQSTNFTSETNVHLPQRMVFYDSQSKLLNNSDSQAINTNNTSSTHDIFKPISETNQLNTETFKIDEEKGAEQNIVQNNFIPLIKTPIISSEYSRINMNQNQSSYVQSFTSNRSHKLKKKFQDPTMSSSKPYYKNYFRKISSNKPGTQFTSLPNSQINNSNNFNKLLHHRPNKSVHLEHSDYSSSTRPLISYDDLESQSNSFLNDSFKINSNILNFKKIIPYDKSQTQKFDNYNNNRQHVQKLLAETRGLKVDSN